MCKHIILYINMEDEGMLYSEEVKIFKETHTYIPLP